MSRVVEQTADNAVNNVKSIKDFELSSKNLQKKLKPLSAKASDVEKEIKNAERSGQNKRKREVEEWLSEAKAIEKEVDLGSLLDLEGFIRRLIDGGNIAQLNEQVDKLVEQILILLTGLLIGGADNQYSLQDLLVGTNYKVRMLFEAILLTLDLVLPKVVRESFLSKVRELIADSALNNVKNMMNLEATLKNLQKNLKSLSCRACDVDEQIKNEEVSGQKKRKREVEEWLRQVESIEAEIQEMGAQPERIITRLMHGGKAAKLNEQVEKLVDQSRNFGELFLDVCGVRGVTLLTNEMVGEAFEENVETILRILEAKQVSSIGVHGVGGAGKTTLAKHIHNRLVERSEGTVCWVTVTKEYSIKSLQDKIGRCLGVKLLSEEEEGIRAGRLYGALKQQKNAVVIFLVKVGCPSSVECCRLILTTRSLQVCRGMGCQRVIVMERLVQDDE